MIPIAWDWNIVAWPSQFLAIPVAALDIAEPIQPSPKATPEQLRAIMRNVPEIYNRLASGLTPTDFQRMGTSPLNQREQEIAETYKHLYSTSNHAERLEAEFVDGQGIIVTKGRHRVDAARQIGLPYVPVHLRARDQETLARLSSRMEAEVSSMQPTAVDAHRTIDSMHRQSRGEPVVIQAEKTLEREPGIDRMTGCGR